MSPAFHTTRNTTVYPERRARVALADITRQSRKALQDPEHPLNVEIRRRAKK